MDIIDFANDHILETTKHNFWMRSLGEWPAAIYKYEQWEQWIQWRQRGEWIVQGFLRETKRWKLNDELWDESRGIIVHWPQSRLNDWVYSEAWDYVKKRILWLTVIAQLCNHSPLSESYILTRSQHNSSPWMSHLQPTLQIWEAAQAYSFDLQQFV